MKSIISNRWSLLDYARIVTAFLVIFAHLLPKDDLRFYIYQFHMPLFFIISGMLYRYQDNRECVLKNIKAIIVPFITFLLVPAFVDVFAVGLNTCVVEFKQSIRGIVFSGPIPTNWVLWFLVVLFHLKVGTNLLRSINWYVGVGIYVILLIVSLKVNLFFIGQTLMAFPLFYLGVRYKSHIKQFTTQLYFKYLFIPAFIIVYLVYILNGRVSMNTWLYGNYSIPVVRVGLFYLNATIGTLGVFSLCSWLTKIETDIIVKLSGSLITIMCAQYIFIDIANIYFNTENMTIITLLLLSVVIMSLCYILHRIIILKVPFLLGRF